MAMDSASAMATAPPLPPRGIKKVLSKRSGSSVPESTSETASLYRGQRGSIDSNDKSPSRLSRELSRDSSREGSSKSGGSGMRKLIPGHARRKRKQRRESERAAVEEEGEQRGRAQDLDTLPPISALNDSSTSLSHDIDNSLLTDDSEPETAPPLVSRDSHSPFLTISSPLITTTTVDTTPLSGQFHSGAPPHAPAPASSSHVPSRDVSPATSPVFPAFDSAPTIPSALSARPETLGPPANDRIGRRESISSSIRSLGAGSKLRQAFRPGRSEKSPQTSPDRESVRSFGESVEPVKRKAVPPPINTNSLEGFESVNASVTSIDLNKPPSTPPSASSIPPVTTVTPPTPTNPTQAQTNVTSPRRNTESPVSYHDTAGVVVSPSGNMISHRRAKSSASALHQPSKLSNSVLAPLTPAAEETKAPSRSATPSGGFFSSWVSAAQNAATTFTNTLNIESKSRSVTPASELERTTPAEKASKVDPPPTEPTAPKKQLAVETLGSGDLNLSHLGIDLNNNTDERSFHSVRPELEDLRKNSTVRRDEAAAKIEDMLAKRAVSAAYEKTTPTPVAEIADPMASAKAGQGINNAVIDEAQGGNLPDDESGSINRSASIRSRMNRRRSRASSGATGASTIGTIIGASTATLANPAGGTKGTGFTVAPKARNRTFHQLFRSVPEDDFLIEDYSCALQRDILLAGRIYISEGHICFSSNILGWVTTLVISFEEVVSVEKENTAMVFPNAIAIQTLHARHTFRSLLSREATYELVIGIWKASHPAAFKKSGIGKELEAAAQKTETNGESETESNGGSDEDEEFYEEDEEDDGAGSLLDTVDGSIAGSDTVDTKTGNRKGSGLNGNPPGPALPYPSASGDVNAGVAVAAVVSDAMTDFPGPATHPPTECTDGATHYEKIIKDEVIAAPLGKIYSMLFGPKSGVFLNKYLTEEQKVLDLQLEDDKKGISNDIKSRTYSYIKPLGGSIGPKQTRCITTENMDVFDLEKSVSVTCSTQTPDVPSGNVFSTKTRYCLSWAPGNATRFQMNCTVEWTGKSWLKGPIEKGATDGQLTYGNELVKSLKVGVSRPRAATTGSKGPRTNKKRRKAGSRSTPAPSAEVAKKEENWGMFELLRRPLGPVVGIFRAFATGGVAVTIIVFLLVLLWLRSPGRSVVGGVGYPGYSSSERIAAYEQMWQKEENELWEWLEDRVGVEGLGFQTVVGSGKKKGKPEDAKTRQRKRQKILGGKDMEAKLREARMSQREVEDAIKITQERLDQLKDVVERHRTKQPGV